jgi:hypothetical protein
MSMSKETWIVAALCAADLFTTLLLVHHGGAQEGNTLMCYYLAQGTGAFVAAKCMLFVPALLIAEWYRRQNPQLVAAALRTVILLYVTFYTVGVLQMNRQVASAELGWDQRPPQTAPTIAIGHRA